MTIATTRTVRDTARAVLRTCGMTTIFGNPGSTEMGFFSDWPSDFRYILALQEASAVAMADGWAQVTGNAAFVNLHSAAGLGNALGNVYTAHRNQTPLVLMAGQQHRAMFQSQPFLFAQQAEAFPQPYVKWSCEPALPADVPAAIARGYHLAMQPPQGPVFISVPLGDWDAPAAPLPERTVSGRQRADPDALAEAAARLDAARSPVIVVGPAVDAGGGFDDAADLAERLAAPVWASPRSPRASFPEDHPAFAGFLPFDPAGIRAALDGHDLILVAGAPVFTLHVYNEGSPVPEGSQVIHLTADPDEAARAVAHLSVVGAVVPAMNALSQLARERPGSPTGRSPAPPPEAPTQGAKMSAPYVLDRLARLLPEETVIVEEAPSHRHAMHDYLPIRRPGGFYTGASGGLGWAMPAAVGIKLADPERPVVCLVGDGSAMYSPQALWSAAESEAAVVFIVMNNGGYGAMKGFAERHGVAGGPSFDLGHLDFSLIARGQGCRAHSVGTPEEFDAALAEALSSRQPTLIDVPLAPEAPTVA